MQLSILTVCLNSETTIADTISSVMQQEFNDYEHIIFDGGSTDKTVEIIKSFGPSIKLFQGKDSGIFDAMNQAIAFASGDVIGILNSDDVYVHNKVLSEVVEKFDSTGSDTVYGDLIIVARSNTNKVWRKWHSGTYNKANFISGWAPPHPTFFVKKQIYQKYGLFDPDFDISGDYELMLRFLYKNNVSAAYIPDYLVKMRTGGNSSGGLIRKWTSFKEDRLSWKMNKLKPRFFTVPLKVLRKVWQFAWFMGPVK